jgi:hypothetical protein
MTSCATCSRIKLNLNSITESHQLPRGIYHPAYPYPTLGRADSASFSAASLGLLGALFVYLICFSTASVAVRAASRLYGPTANLRATRRANHAFARQMRAGASKMHCFLYITGSIKNLRAIGRWLWLETKRRVGSSLLARCRAAPCSLCALRPAQRVLFIKIL